MPIIIRSLSCIDFVKKLFDSMSSITTSILSLLEYRRKCQERKCMDDKITLVIVLSYTTVHSNQQKKLSFY